MEEELGFAQDLSKSTFDGGRIEDGILDPCVICLEAVTERAITIPCRHESFDFLCIVSWLQEHPTCPLCKSEVHSVRYGFEKRGFQTYTVPPIYPTPTTSISSPILLACDHHGRYRSAARRHLAARLTAPAPNPNEALLRRRQVYREQLYSLHVGSNRLSRFRDVTPDMIVHNEGLLSRARKWIRRELQVFEFLNTTNSGEETFTRKAPNPAFLLEYIIAILKTVDLKGSGGQAEDMLQELLGRDNTKLFIHELRAWLRSPYTSLEEWDMNVQYNESTDHISEANHVAMKRDHSAFQGDYYRPLAVGSTKQPQLQLSSDKHSTS